MKNKKKERKIAAETEAVLEPSQASSFKQNSHLAIITATGMASNAKNKHYTRSRTHAPTHAPTPNTTRIKNIKSQPTSRLDDMILLTPEHSFIQTEIKFQQHHQQSQRRWRRESEREREWKRTRSHRNKMCYQLKPVYMSNAHLPLSFAAFNHARITHYRRGGFLHFTLSFSHTRRCRSCFRSVWCSHFASSARFFCHESELIFRANFVTSLTALSCCSASHFQSVILACFDARDRAELFIQASVSHLVSQPPWIPL